MSALAGYPDYQRITQWLGTPLVQATGLVIDAGTHVDGPLQAANFASVIVALKASVGNVTVTIKQTVPSGPASLVLTQTVVVPAGATLFEAFVLFGAAVELDLTGSVAGTSVDYALYGSNTTTNAQVITAATINVQHSEVLVAAEGTLDFVDASGFVWTVTDDAPGLRVKVTPPAPIVSHTEVTAGVGLGAATVIVTAPAFTFDGVAAYDFDFFCAVVGVAGVGVTATFDLYEDGVVKERLAGMHGFSDQLPCFGRARFVPAAGSHTYSVRGTAGGGACTANAGNGTGGATAPIFLRVSRF